MTEREKQTGHPSLLIHLLGFTFAFCGVGMLLSAAVELTTTNTDDWGPLLILGGLFSCVGYLMWLLTSVPGRIPLLDVFATVASAWIAMSLIGTLPYLLTGTLTDLDLALFESVSGFTAVG